jgi:hypothetical protein
MLKRVKFLQPHRIGLHSLYNVDETAGFEPELADRLIAKGVAILDGDGIPKNADGSPVVSKSGLTRARELLGEAVAKVAG